MRTSEYVEDTYFNIVHFFDSLQSYPFQGVSAVWQGRSRLFFLYHHKLQDGQNAFFHIPRFAVDEKLAFVVYRHIKEEVSMTHCKPYPQEHEIGLPGIS